MPCGHVSRYAILASYAIAMLMLVVLLVVLVVLVGSTGRDNVHGLASGTTRKVVLVHLDQCASI